MSLEIVEDLVEIATDVHATRQLFVPLQQRGEDDLIGDGVDGLTHLGDERVSLLWRET